MWLHWRPLSRFMSNTMLRPGLCSIRLTLIWIKKKENYGSLPIIILKQQKRTAIKERWRSFESQEKWMLQVELACFNSSFLIIYSHIKSGKFLIVSNHTRFILILICTESGSCLKIKVPRLRRASWGTLDRMIVELYFFRFVSFERTYSFSLVVEAPELIYIILMWISISCFQSNKYKINSLK